MPEHGVEDHNRASGDRQRYGLDRFSPSFLIKMHENRHFSIENHRKTGEKTDLGSIVAMALRHDQHRRLRLIDSFREVPRADLAQPPVVRRRDQ